MGRGRAKAKQTKVARELKYSSQGTDFAALQRELASGSVERSDMTETEQDEYDEWAAGDNR
jgi:hypothetical protein